MYAALLYSYSFLHLQPSSQGSITGAYSPLAAAAAENNDGNGGNGGGVGGSTPSFILLAVQDTKIVCYVYELKGDDEVDVSKTEFNKIQLTRHGEGGASSAQQQGGNPALMQSLLS